MTDLFQISADLPHHVAHVKAAAPACTQVINQGYTMFTTAIVSTLSLLVGGTAGYFIGKRGLTGFKNDLNNIKTDIENLKAKVSAVTSAATTAAHS